MKKNKLFNQRKIFSKILIISAVFMVLISLNKVDIINYSEYKDNQYKDLIYIIEKEIFIDDVLYKGSLKPFKINTTMYYPLDLFRNIDFTFKIDNDELFIYDKKDVNILRKYVKDMDDEVTKNFDAKESAFFYDEEIYLSDKIIKDIFFLDINLDDEIYINTDLSDFIKEIVYNYYDESDELNIYNNILIDIKPISEKFRNYFDNVNIDLNDFIDLLGINRSENKEIILELKDYIKSSKEKIDNNYENSLLNNKINLLSKIIFLIENNVLIYKDKYYIFDDDYLLIIKDKLYNTYTNVGFSFFTKNYNHQGRYCSKYILIEEKNNYGNFSYKYNSFYDKKEYELEKVFHSTGFIARRRTIYGDDIFDISFNAKDNLQSGNVDYEVKKDRYSAFLYNFDGYDTFIEMDDDVLFLGNSYIYQKLNGIYLRKGIDTIDNNLLDNRVDEIINEIIPEDVSDEKKIEIIFKYILENVVYDPNFPSEEDTTRSLSHTAYGAIINGIAVCDGYAEAFKMFLDRFNIKNHLVFGRSGFYRDDESRGNTHAWNVLLLDGEYRYYDLTFADGSSYKYSLNYFNKTKEEFERTHFWDEERIKDYFIH